MVIKHQIVSKLAAAATTCRRCSPADSYSLGKTGNPRMIHHAIDVRFHLRMMCPSTPLRCASRSLNDRRGGNHARAQIRTPKARGERGLELDMHATLAGAVHGARARNPAKAIERVSWERQGAWAHSRASPGFCLLGFLLWLASELCSATQRGRSHMASVRGFLGRRGGRASRVQVQNGSLVLPS